MKGQQSMLDKGKKNGDKRGEDCDKDLMFKKLSEAISALVCVKRDELEQRRKEFDWLKSHAGLATKQDLERMERRLTDAISKNAPITPAIVAAAERLGASLDKLDATVPDQQT